MVKADPGSDDYLPEADPEVTMRMRQDGFAMLDVLTALMLLAVTLTVACVTLIQTMRSTHDALLATRAVDLAADLSEALKQAQGPDELEPLVTAWRERVRATLPVAGIAPEEVASVAAVTDSEREAVDPQDTFHVLTLHWRGARGNVEELILPVVAFAGS